MLDIPIMKSATIHPENGLKFINMQYADILALTSDYGELNLDFYGVFANENLNNNHCFLKMAPDYLFSTIKTDKTFCTIKIDNNSPLTTKQVILAETLSKLIYYSQITRKNINLKKQIMNKLNIISSNPYDVADLAYNLNQMSISLNENRETLIIIDDNCNLYNLTEEIPLEFTNDEKEELDSIPYSSSSPNTKLLISTNGIIINADDEQEK